MEKLPKFPNTIHGIDKVTYDGLAEVIRYVGFEFDTFIDEFCAMNGATKNKKPKSKRAKKIKDQLDDVVKTLINDVNLFSQVKPIVLNQLKDIETYRKKTCAMEFDLIGARSKNDFYKNKYEIERNLRQHLIKKSIGDEKMDNDEISLLIESLYLEEELNGRLVRFIAYTKSMFDTYISSIEEYRKRIPKDISKLGDDGSYTIHAYGFKCVDTETSPEGFELSSQLLLNFETLASKLNATFAEHQYFIKIISTMIENGVLIFDNNSESLTITASGLITPDIEKHLREDKNTIESLKAEVEQLKRENKALNISLLMDKSSSSSGKKKKKDCDEDVKKLLGTYMEDNYRLNERCHQLEESCDDYAKKIDKMKLEYEELRRRTSHHYTETGTQVDYEHKESTSQTECSNVSVEIQTQEEIVEKADYHEKVQDNSTQTIVDDDILLLQIQTLKNELSALERKYDDVIQDNAYQTTLRKMHEIHVAPVLMISPETIEVLDIKSLNCYYTSAIECVNNTARFANTARNLAQQFPHTYELIDEVNTLYLQCNKNVADSLYCLQRIYELSKSLGYNDSTLLIHSCVYVRSI